MDVHSHAHHMEIGEESVVWSTSFQLPEKNALQPVSYLGCRVRKVTQIRDPQRQADSKQQHSLPAMLYSVC